ncbi:FHA domain-containing protein, partial [Singulisphaera rosea]
MATLEVHDGEGRVSRVEISRDQAVLFGSNPKCDIVLEGPGILPYHGRLRWKSSRYKADAFPDAEYLEINGTKMTSSSLRQGDEITVGPCRIFMLYADDPIPPAKDDATRVQPAPVFNQTPPEPRKRNRSRRREEPVDLEDLEVAPPSVEVSLEDPRSEAWDWDRPPEAEQPKGRPKKTPRKLPGFLNFNRDAPGQEKILTSPLVIGLVTSLVILVISGVVLKSIIAKTVATRLYQRAIESLDNGDYRNAVVQFEQYLAYNPNDPKSTSQARVLKALANVRQFTSSTGASWTNALEAEREMLEKVSQEPAYRDSSSDLADEVIKTGEALADRSKSTADARTLGEAEAAL